MNFAAFTPATCCASRWLARLAAALLFLACGLSLAAGGKRSAKPEAAPASATAPASAPALAPAEPAPGRPISMRFHDITLRDVFDMLSRQEHINILMGKGVEGTVSVNLYNVTAEQAVQAVAGAAGYAVEMRHGSYLVMDRKEVGQETAQGNTAVRAFKVQYTNPKQVADILKQHLSRYGKITPLAERNLLLVEDLPEFLQRIERLLAEIDVEPKQILIEARILEITLDKSETFGVDWSHVFGGGGQSTVGTQGQANKASAGLFFNLVNRNLDLYLSALSDAGRVQTLSTPRLLALENNEASAVIGDRIGYKVTTTINQVTSETIQFLDTGVILKVTPSVDQRGRVLMQIHPEVSSATIAAGIPSKKSTEVTTQLLCEDGQSIFIGGLIKRNVGTRRTGVPLLSDVPGVGRLFSSTQETGTVTETVVVITPRIVTSPAQAMEQTQVAPAMPQTTLSNSTGLRLDIAEQ